MENKVLETEVKPVMKNWSILFFNYEYDHLTDRAQKQSVLEDLAKSFNSGTTFCAVESPDRPNSMFRISGSVYGREGFDDGDLIKTSAIKKIEKIDEDLWFATNHRGSGYYIRPSEATIDTALKLYMKPVIKNWFFEFDEKSLNEAATEASLPAKELKDRAIFAFINIFKSGSVCPPIITSISGNIYGHKDRKHGENVSTDVIKQITILKWQPPHSAWFFGDYSLDDIQDFQTEIYEVTLQGGDIVYIRSGEEDLRMILDNSVQARMFGFDDE